MRSPSQSNRLWEAAAWNTSQAMTARKMRIAIRRSRLNMRFE
jgi:hypothetical protein